MDEIKGFLNFLQATFEFFKSFGVFGYILLFLFAVVLSQAMAVMRNSVILIGNFILWVVNKFLIAGLKLLDWLLILRLKKGKNSLKDETLGDQRVSNLILVLFKINTLTIKLENKNKQNAKKIFRSKVKDRIFRALIASIMTILLSCVIFGKQFNYYYTSYFPQKVTEKCVPDENFKFPKGCKIKSV